jgi:hypothetical protein
MELHMGQLAAYDLDYVPGDDINVDRELAGLEADPTTKRDVGALLRVLKDIAERGRDAEGENIHLASTIPHLHSVEVGQCVAYYAYGPSRSDGKTIFLLGFYRTGSHLRYVGVAASRLPSIP